MVLIQVMMVEVLIILLFGTKIVYYTEYCRVSNFMFLLVLAAHLYPYHSQIQLCWKFILLEQVLGKEN